MTGLFRLPLATLGEVWGSKVRPVRFRQEKNYLCAPRPPHPAKTSPLIVQK
jgi:hypothetical protein